MSWFRKKPTQKELLQKKIEDYREQEELARLVGQVNAFQARQTLPGEPIQESVMGMLNDGGIFTVTNLLQPYRELLAIPGMIRERMVYKSAVVRTIQQADFIRFCCKAVYEECTHFQAVVKHIEAMVIGADGLNIEIVAKKNKKVSDAKLAELNEIVKELDEANRITIPKIGMAAEGIRRYEIMGEAFAQIIDDPRDIPGKNRRITRIVFMEPDFIRPSERKAVNFEDPQAAGGPTNDHIDWSFGIKNKSFDYTLPEAYQVVWPNGDEEVIPATKMVHLKNVEYANIKRGVSTAFAILEEMIGAVVLRFILREGAKLRAAISGVVEHDQASPYDMSRLADHMGERQGTTTEQKADQNGNTYNLTRVNVDPAGILHIGKCSKFVEGPKLPDGPSMKLIYDQTLNAIACHYQVPPNVVNGEPAGAAYASALVEENSHTRAREEDQGTHCRFWKEIFEIVLPIELDRRGINRAILDKVEIQITGASLVIRNKKEEAETDTILMNAKVKARETVQAEQGLDPKEEDEKIQTDDMAPENLETDETEGEPETTGGKRQKEEGL